MARLPRYFVKRIPLHIILRGSNREPIFGNDEDCQFFKEVLQDAAQRHEMAIHAYVFMTNHNDDKELKALKLLAAQLLGYDHKALEKAVKARELIEVKHEKT